MSERYCGCRKRCAAKQIAIPVWMKEPASIVIA
jgi:hypothetical protein